MMPGRRVYAEGRRRKKGGSGEGRWRVAAGGWVRRAGSGHSSARGRGRDTLWRRAGMCGQGVPVGAGGVVMLCVGVRT